ncbi:MAG: DUF2079 domain-containing protein, partial [Desulfobacteraceae bacterium]|nr:DUF2079 domain-containing protein [Desulfobacteraceae bacterium]
LLYYLSTRKIHGAEGVKASWRRCSVYIERHVYVFLIGFILIHLLWSGFVIFMNPYEWGFNHGDAVFYTQTLRNMVEGLRPESSYFALGAAYNPLLDDPRYCGANGYVSIFTLHQCWLPLLILSPLYALYPFPPMHIYASLIVVAVLGVSGMFLAIRAMGGSKILALLGACGYVLLPHVESLLFFKGYYDVLGFAVLPWVFAALFARKWWLLYVSALCLAAISYPFTYTAMMIGLVTAIFFKAVAPGSIVFLIGFLMMKWDGALYVSILQSYKDVNAMPSFLKYYVLDRTVGSLIQPARIYLVYMGSILQAGAFLPLFQLRRDSKWNMPVIGLLVLTALCFFPMLFRSAAWEVPRNCMLIVPLYVSVFMAYTGMGRQSENPEIAAKSSSGKKIAAMCLSCCLIAMILFGNGYSAPSPLASHYPFGSNAKLSSTKFTAERKNALDKLARYVPQNATLAFIAEGDVDALLANRQHAWYMGRAPEGVQYYVFFGIPDALSMQKTRDDFIKKMQQDAKFLLLYRDDSVPLLIYENRQARPIPRQENLLGWSVILKAFGHR